MKKASILLTVALVAALATGCTKKVQLTVINHTDTARTVELTVPDETQTLGTVGPDGGKLTGLMVVKTSDLPAQVRLSASGAATSFTVTQDSPNRWWFHVTQSGKLAGPYGQEDRHTETFEDADINVKSEPKMIVR